MIRTTAREWTPIHKIIVTQSIIRASAAVYSYIRLIHSFVGGPPTPFKRWPPLRRAPDGKVIVMVAANEDGYRLDGFSCSLQQKSAADDIALHRTVRAALKDELGVLAAVFAGLSPEVPESLSVNGAGAFEVGGPEGDNGLSGKDFSRSTGPGRCTHVASQRRL
jgi:hypothetical protein